MSLIASSSSSRSYKVCFVCESIRGKDRVGRDTGGCDVFSVDVSPSCGGGRRSPPRVLQSLFEISMEYPSHMGFFAFHSKIYLIGGLLEPDRKLMSRDVYVYDTSSPADGIKEEVRRMKHGKCSPLVIGPLNDDKFYVMSPWLTYKDFEVFDPKFGTWYCPSQALSSDYPSPRLHQYLIRAHAVVKKGREILLSTKSSGIFSYDTVTENWSHCTEGSLPFCGGAVCIGGDRFLVVKHLVERDQMALCTYCYNSSAKVWDGFQLIRVIGRSPNTDLLSLGDGLVCRVYCRFDGGSSDVYDVDEPGKHIISLEAFGTRPNQEEEVGSLSFEPFFFGEHVDKCDTRDVMRFLSASFPLDVSHHLEPEAEHLEDSVNYLAETSLRGASRRSKSKSRSDVSHRPESEAEHLNGSVTYLAEASFLGAFGFVVSLKFWLIWLMRLIKRKCMRSY